MPLVTNGLSGSLGIAFLLTVMPTSFERASASLPVMPAGRRSTSMRWLSVPPETRRRPHSTIASPIALGVDRRTWSMYALNSGCSASPNATALAAMTCSSGPPCMPGENGLVDRLGVLLLAEDEAAARAAQRLVRGGGDEVGVGHRETGAAPVATRPAMCAMSTMSSAPTSSAIAREALEVDRCAGRPSAPAMIILGLCSWARRSTSS